MKFADYEFAWPRTIHADPIRRLSELPRFQRTPLAHTMGRDDEVHSDAAGRWIPALVLGGLVTLLILPAWQFAATKQAPPSQPIAGEAHRLPTAHIRLQADASGRLAAIAVNGQAIKDIPDLQTHIRQLAGKPSATIDVELDCDPQLRYEHTQQTIAAISTYKSADGRTIRQVDRVKFSPRRSPKP